MTIRMKAENLLPEIKYQTIDQTFTKYTHMIKDDESKFLPDQNRNKAN